jgi:hypothetical protein
MKGFNQQKNSSSIAAAILTCGALIAELPAVLNEQGRGRSAIVIVYSYAVAVFI